MPSIRFAALRGASAIALLATSAAAFAGEIRGTVADSTGTRTLQGAQITIVELKRVAQVGDDGTYWFGDVPPGTYTVRAEYEGVAPVLSSVTVPAEGPVVQNFALGAQSGEILVIGQRANLLGALSRQRAADGVQSVLTRDAIGQFPDQNVAESLRRLPGVNVLNDQGEGRFVSIRGLDPNLNSSSVNGVRLPAPESDIRAVALDVVSSDLIESIEVKKTLTPDMDADTIGASIEINTTSAFDLQKPLISGTIEGSYNRKSDSLTPRVGAEFSVPLTDNFGIAGGLSFYQRKFSTDNVETGGWSTSDAGIDFTDEVEYRDYDVERKRFNASLSLDLRASETTTLYARGLYSQFDDQEFRNRLIFGFDEEPSAASGGTVTFSDADGEIAVERDIKDRFESQKIRSIVVGGNTELEAWKFDYAASWAKSSERENGSLDPTVFKADFEGTGLDVAFDFGDEMIPRYVVSGNTADFFDPSNFGFDEVERTALSDAVDEEYAIRADAARTFGFASGDLSVQAGFKSRWRQKSYEFETEIFDEFDGDFTLADVLGEQSYGLALIDPVPGGGITRDFFNANRARFGLNALDSAFESAAADYQVDEDVLAGYLLGRWDSTTLRVIGGMRVERTTDDIRGNLVELFDGVDGPCGEELCVTPNRFDTRYTTWLPSLNIRFEPSPGLVFRAAGFRSLVRPNLGDLAPRFLVEESDEGEREGEFGNPALSPYKAWNFEAAAEYYFSRSGAVSANIFHKKIQDFIVRGTFEGDENDPFGGVFNGIEYDEASIPLNGDSASVTGLELSYAQVFNFLPKPFDGLLVNFNYTYTDAKGRLIDGREIPLPASAKNTFNAVLGYEKGPFSVRLAGAYRDKFLEEVGGSADDDRYTSNHFQLDLSARYWVTPKIQLFGDWINMTDEPYFAYQNLNGRRRLLQYEEYDWTIKGGVRVRF